MRDFMIFRNEDLMPAAWRHLLEGPVWAFNPGLLRDGDGWLFAYRIVGGDERRRIGLCRLDSTGQVVAESQTPLTDFVSLPADGVYPEQARSWFADPRLYRLQGRLFVYWNSGWHEPHNCQFLQEVDPASLLPLGHPRELQLKGERQKLEKNWMFFQGSDGCRAIYSPMPHRVLAFSLDGDREIVFHDAGIAPCETPLVASVGALRGGAPPQRVGERFFSICHAIHDSPEGYRYLPAVYQFASTPPYQPIAWPQTTLTLANPFGATTPEPKLATVYGEVLYPCGAAYDSGDWIISYGINNSYCAINKLRAAELTRTFRAG